MNLEKGLGRCATSVRMREDGTKTISGTAAVFYREGDTSTEYALVPDGSAVERIMPSAFSSFRSDDVRALFNHDPSRLLGRSKSGEGSLRLTVDSTGLHYEIEPRDDATYREVVGMLERGDVDGSSFQFRAREHKWVTDGNRDVREIHDVELFDVGPVTFPAYSGSAATVRAEVRANLDEMRETRQRAQDAIQRKARECELWLTERFLEGK